MAAAIFVSQVQLQDLQGYTRRKVANSQTELTRLSFRTLTVGPAEHLLSNALTVARSRSRFRSSPLENWVALGKDLVGTPTFVACPT